MPPLFDYEVYEQTIMFKKVCLVVCMVLSAPALFAVLYAVANAG